MSGFRVELDALDAHAARVEALAGRAREAASAVRGPGPDAFGLVGRLFGAQASTRAAETARSLGALAAAAYRQAVDLRACALEYRRGERDAVVGFEGPR